MDKDKTIELLRVALKVLDAQHAKTIIHEGYLEDAIDDDAKRAIDNITAQDDFHQKLDAKQLKLDAQLKQLEKELHIDISTLVYGDDAYKPIA